MVGSLTITFVANLSLSLTAKEFWKSVKMWQSYHHEFGGPLFLEHSVVMLNVFSETEADIPVYLLVQTEKYLFTNHCNSFLGLFII